jgi:hypothetical protein
VIYVIYAITDGGGSPFRPVAGRVTGTASRRSRWEAERTAVAHTIDRAEAVVPDGTGGTGQELSPAQIEAEIERTRTQLAGTIDEIADRVHPKRVVQRGRDRLRRRAGEAVGQVRERLVDGNGRPRKAPAVVAAAGVTALVAFGIWRRRH